MLNRTQLMKYFSIWIKAEMIQHQWKVVHHIVLHLQSSYSEQYINPMFYCV